MSVSIIAAVADQGAIGRRGDLAFHISADLKRFKSLTMGHPVVMGRRTFESLPKGALPGRRNIVITANADWSAPGTEVAHSLEEALDMAGDGVFVIGGGKVYSQALLHADTLHITRIFARCEDADTFFPDIPSDFVITDKSEICDSEIPYQFITYRKK